jgi:hypothetical protein
MNHKVPNFGRYLPSARHLHKRARLTSSCLTQGSIALASGKSTESGKRVELENIDIGIEVGLPT